MKVCTDACIFGACVAEFIAGRSLSNTSCLDIGTGTGLLSLLLAQKTNALIDAVEIDEAASLQAKENFDGSPWKDRLHIFNTNALAFIPEKKYDYIIANPPFFEGDLKSGNEKKNTARHDTDLTFQQLLQLTDTHLKEDGFFSVLLPFQRTGYFEKAAEVYHFSMVKKILLKQTTGHAYFRSILFFSRILSTAIINELIIKDEEGKYTQPVVELLKDYYLAF